MSDGRPFNFDTVYTVAINSYRGNGGGELLTVGAGISKDELSSRIIGVTSKDMRYYLMQYIAEHGNIDPQPLGLWKFVPEEWTVNAIERDRILLFGNLSDK